MLDLSAPKVITSIASVVLALVAVVIHYAHIKVPFFHHGLLHFVVGLCSACCRQLVSRRLVPLAPRLVHRQHLSVVGIGPRVAHGWGAVRFCTIIFYVGLGTEPSCVGLLFRQRMRYSEDAL